MKIKSTKRALLTSTLSLLLCFAMLIGTTYAWFTDSVSSANNIIQSGNLDIELDYLSGDTWKDVHGSSEVLDAQALWEPGYTEVVYLRMRNAGSLMLKYQLGINIAAETAGVNAAGGELLLSNYIYFDMLESTEFTKLESREDAMKKTTCSTLISEGYTKANLMAAKSEYVYFTMIVYMPSSVENEANHNGKDLPKIELGINLFATQASFEADSFGSDYDDNAAAFTVKEANAILANNEDIMLINCVDPSGVLVVPQNYTGTLTLANVSIGSIQMDDTAVALAQTEDAAEALNLVILGDVFVQATEDNTSAITANKINISGTGTLTAIAKGTHAYGIGGDSTTEITIKDVRIRDVQGGSVQQSFINDTKYGKTEPEGGAAIGSGYNGAVITLDNVTIERALGGSKAAAIGGQFWTGVTINIINSEIIKAVGGNASAAIGGSRVSQNRAENDEIVINITNSIIKNAQGGQFGSGIGSGYDTHCGKDQPLCTINVTDSQITAKGGQYAAGVGTGFHHAALTGVITNSTINATSGEKVYKDSYTAAMDVGFGVIDPAREGVQTDSKLIFNGVEITTTNSPDIVTDSTDLANTLKAGATSIYLLAGNYTLPSLKDYDGVTIVGAEDVTASPVNSFNFGKNTTVKNISITNSSGSAVRNGYTNGNVTFEDCKFIGTQWAFHIDGASGGHITLNRCTFKNRVALAASGTYEFNDCTFLYQVSNYNTINIYSTATFNNCSWASKLELSIDTGAKAIIDGEEITQRVIFISDASGMEAFAREVNSRGNDYAGKIVMLSADIDMSTAYYKNWTPIGQTGATQFKGTFDGHGYTIRNLNVNSSKKTDPHYASGLFGWLNNAVVKNVTFENATIVGNHNVGVVAGYLETAGCTISNCHVINATITATHVDNEVCGDKVGVIVGHAGNTGVKVEGCTATDCTVVAGRDAGQITGAALTANVSGCSATNVTVTADGSCTGANVREECIGRVLG